MPVVREFNLDNVLSVFGCLWKDFISYRLLKVVYLAGGPLNTTYFYSSPPSKSDNSAVVSSFIECCKM